MASLLECLTNLNGGWGSTSGKLLWRTAWHSICVSGIWFKAPTMDGWRRISWFGSDVANVRVIKTSIGPRCLCLFVYFCWSFFAQVNVYLCKKRFFSVLPMFFFLGFCPWCSMFSYGLHFFPKKSCVWQLFELWVIPSDLEMVNGGFLRLLGNHESPVASRCWCGCCGWCGWWLSPWA